MKATMILCDHAQVAENKLFINGGGWNLCGTPTPPHAVALLLWVPWDRTGQRIEYELRLVDEDGKAVLREAPVGPVPVGASGAVEVARPDAPPGTSLTVPLVVNVAPLALPGDTGFEWRLYLEGETADDWSLPFRTLPAVPA